MKMNVFKTLLIMLMALSFALSMPAAAQPSDPDAANCEELKDPDVKFELDLCSAHVGCGLVMGIQKACVKTKKFLNNLKSIVTRDDTEAKEAQAADTSLFGKLKSFVGGLGKKEVTSNQVFEASMSDQARSLQSTDKDWKDSAAPIQTGIAKADKQQLTGAATNGVNATYTYVGDVKDGKPNGWGTQYWSTGQITRGQFKDGALYGAGEITQAEGSHKVGTYENSKLEGAGLALLSDGRVYKGQYSGDQAQGMGAVYRADGSLVAKGQYEKNSLSIGEIYDAQGNVTQSIDKPRDAQFARAAAEQEFRNNLNGMTAPQLYAKADELSSSDKNKSNQMLQALMSRFPNHPLAKRASEQIAAEQAATAEAARRQAEAQRRQSILAQQQAEQARQQAEEEKRLKEARTAETLQNITKFLDVLSTTLQQSRQGGSGNSSDSCPNGGNLVNGQCRIGVAQ